MPVRRPLALLLAAGATVATGCGSTAGANPDSASFKDPQQKAIVTALKDFSDSTRKRDYSGICSDQLAVELKDSLDKGATCKDRLERSLRDVDATDLAVLAITVKGAVAEATVQPTGTGDVEPKAFFRLAKEGTRWKLSGIN